MKKIKTILPKDKNNLGLVTNGSLIKDISYFKIKIDGTSCMIKDKKIYGRYDIKIFKNKNNEKVYLTQEELNNKIPKDAIACQEPDVNSGHWPHWVLINENDTQYKYILEAFNNLENKLEGTYEAIGPKIQGNPHNEEKHILIPHFSNKLNFKIDFEEMNKNPFDYFKNLFLVFNWEGLVAYNSNNEPIGKIRRSDFGYKKDFKYNKASELVS